MGGRSWERSEEQRLGLRCLGFPLGFSGRGKWGLWKKRTPKAEGKLEARSALLSAWSPHTNPRTQCPPRLAAGKCVYMG